MRCCSKKSSPAAQKPPREERMKLAGVNVTLSWPSDDPAITPKGSTFLLPGAMVSVSEYNGLRDVILQQNHLVVSFYVNVLYPFTNNHRHHAAKLKSIFDALQLLHPSLPKSYSIVGHSAGGKIALLVASIIDNARVSAVLALDPVDINPIEFTNEKGSNLPLDDDHKSDQSNNTEESNKGRQQHTHIPIVLTCTDGGLGISKSHDADAIHKLHPATVCYHHTHAGHMAYCDHGGGWAGKLMPDVGTKDGNEKARLAAHKLIRELI